MNLKQYIQTNRGEGKRIAAALDIDKSYLSQMVSNGRPISPERCVAIERETNGIVSRQDLRPDDYWLIWPDLPPPEWWVSKQKNIGEKSADLQPPSADGDNKGEK